MHTGHSSFCLTFVLHFQWPSLCVDPSSGSFARRATPTARQHLLCDAHDYRFHRGLRSSAGLGHHPSSQRQLPPALPEPLANSVAEHVADKNKTSKDVLQDHVCTQRLHRAARVLPRTAAATRWSTEPLSGRVAAPPTAAAQLTPRPSESSTFAVATAFKKWRDWSWPSFVSRLRWELGEKCKKNERQQFPQQQQQTQQQRPPQQQNQLRLRRRNSSSPRKFPRRHRGRPTDISAVDHRNTLHQVRLQCSSCGVLAPIAESDGTTTFLSIASACGTTNSSSTAVENPSHSSFSRGEPCRLSSRYLHFSGGADSCSTSENFTRPLRRQGRDSADQTASPVLCSSQSSAQEPIAAAPWREAGACRGVGERRREDGSAGGKAGESSRRRRRTKRTVFLLGAKREGILLSLFSAISAEPTVEQCPPVSAVPSTLEREAESSSCSPFCRSGFATAVLSDVRVSPGGAAVGESCSARSGQGSSTGSAFDSCSAAAAHRRRSSGFPSRQTTTHTGADTGGALPGCQLKIYSRKISICAMFSADSLVVPAACAAAPSAAPGVPAPAGSQGGSSAASLLAAAAAAVAASSVVVAALTFECARWFLQAGEAAASFFYHGSPVALLVVVVVAKTTGRPILSSSRAAAGEAKGNRFCRSSQPQCGGDLEERNSSRFAVVYVEGAPVRDSRRGLPLACARDASGTASSSTPPGTAAAKTRSSRQSAEVAAAASRRRDSRSGCSSSSSSVVLGLLCQDDRLLVNEEKGEQAREGKVPREGRSSVSSTQQSRHAETEAGRHGPCSVSLQPATGLAPAKETPFYPRAAGAAGKVKLGGPTEVRSMNETAAACGASTQREGRGTSGKTEERRSSLSAARAAQRERAGGGEDFFVEGASGSTGSLPGRQFCSACEDFVGRSSVDLRRRGGFSAPGALLTLAFAAGGTAAAAGRPVPLLAPDDAKLCATIPHSQDTFSQTHTAGSQLVKLQQHLQQQKEQHQQALQHESERQQQFPKQQREEEHWQQSEEPQQQQQRQRQPQQGKPQQRQPQQRQPQQQQPQQQQPQQRRLQQQEPQQREQQQRQKQREQLQRGRLVRTGARGHAVESRLQEEAAEREDRGTRRERVCCSASALFVAFTSRRRAGGPPGEECVAAAEIERKLGAATVYSGEDRRKRMRAFSCIAGQAEPQLREALHRHTSKKKEAETPESCCCLRGFGWHTDICDTVGPLWGLSGSCLLYLGASGLAVAVAVFVNCRGTRGLPLRCGFLSTTCASRHQEQLCYCSSRNSTWVLLLILFVGWTRTAAAHAPDMALLPPVATAARQATAPAAAPGWPAPEAAVAAAAGARAAGDRVAGARAAGDRVAGAPAAGAPAAGAAAAGVGFGVAAGAAANVGAAPLMTDAAVVPAATAAEGCAFAGAAAAADTAAADAAAAVRVAARTAASGSSAAGQLERASGVMQRAKAAAEIFEEVQRMGISAAVEEEDDESRRVVHAAVDRDLQPLAWWLTRGREGGEGELGRRFWLADSLLLQEGHALLSSFCFLPSAKATSAVRPAEERSSSSERTVTPYPCGDGSPGCFAFASVAAATAGHRRSPTCSSNATNVYSPQDMNSSSRDCCNNSADCCNSSNRDAAGSSRSDDSNSSSENCNSKRCCSRSNNSESCNSTGSNRESCSSSESCSRRSQGESRRRNGAICADNIWGGDGDGEEWEDGEARVRLLRLPLTTDNLLALFVLGLLSALGCMHVARVAMEYFRCCKCRLCRGDYLLQYQLGSGGYGTVWVVRRRRDGCEEGGDASLAVLKKIEVEDITEADSYQQEARRLAHLAHEHIVGYEADFIHREQPFGGVRAKIYFMIIMEFCASGDLKQVVDRSYRRLTEEQVRSWFHQLLQAVDHLHKNNVIHRDIKCQNVFLAKDGRVRLGDFGLSRMAAPSPGRQASSRRQPHTRKRENGFGASSARFPALLSFLSEKTSSTVGGKVAAGPALVENTCAARPGRHASTSIASAVDAEARLCRRQRLPVTLSQFRIRREDVSESRSFFLPYTRVRQAEERKEEAETTAAAGGAAKGKKQALAEEMALSGPRTAQKDTRRDADASAAMEWRDRKEGLQAGRSRQQENMKNARAPGFCCTGGSCGCSAAAASADSTARALPTGRRGTQETAAASSAAVAVGRNAFSTCRSRMAFLRDGNAEVRSARLVEEADRRPCSSRRAASQEKDDGLTFSFLRVLLQGFLRAYAARLRCSFCLRSKAFDNGNSISAAGGDACCRDSSRSRKERAGTAPAPARVSAKKCGWEGQDVGKRFSFCNKKNAASSALTLAEPSLFSQAGTGCYMAPEVLNNAAYGKAADMWSLGCVLLELCSGVFMWELKTSLASLLAEETRRGECPVSALDTFLQSLLPRHVITGATRAVIKQLLQTNPSRRPTTTDLLQSSYFLESRKVFQFPFCWSPSLTSAVSRDTQAILGAHPGSAGRATAAAKCRTRATARENRKESDEKKTENVSFAESEFVEGAQGEQRANEEERQKQNSSAAGRSQARENKAEKQKSRRSSPRSPLLDGNERKMWKCRGEEEEKSEVVVLAKEEHAGFTAWAGLAELREGVFTLSAETWRRRLTELIWQLRWFHKKAIRTSGSYELLVQAMSAGCFAVVNAVSFFGAVPALVTAMFTQPRFSSAQLVVRLKKSGRRSVHDAFHAEEDVAAKVSPKRRARDTETAFVRPAGTPNTKMGCPKFDEKHGASDGDNAVDAVHVRSSQQDFAYIDPCFWDVVCVRKYGRPQEEEH